MLKMPPGWLLCFFWLGLVPNVEATNKTIQDERALSLSALSQPHTKTTADAATRPFVLRQRPFFAPGALLQDGLLLSKKKTPEKQPKWLLQPKPSPLEWELIMLQVFSGAIVASVSSFVFKAIFDVTVIGDKPTLETVELAGWLSTLTTFGVVPWLTALTVTLLGRLSSIYTGNFWWSLLGAYLGGGVAFGFGRLLSFLDTTPQKTISAPFRFLMDGLFMGIGAVIFYTLFRRPYQDFIQLGSLIRLDNGTPRWGIPLPQISQTEQGASVWIPVVSGRF